MITPITFPDSISDKSSTSNITLPHTYGRIINTLGETHLTDGQATSIHTILTDVFEQFKNEGEESELKALLIQELEMANTELLQKIEKIIQEHTHLKDHFQTLNDHTSELKKNYTDLNQKYAEETGYQEKLKEEAQKLKEEYQKLEKQYGELESKYLTLRDQEDKLKIKSDVIERDNENLAKEYQDLEKENKTLKTETEIVSQKYLLLETQYGGLEKQTQSLRVGFDDVKQQYLKLQFTFEHFIENQSKMLTQLEKQTKRTDELNRKVDSYHHSLSGLNQYLWLAIPRDIRAIYDFFKKVNDHPYPPQ